MRTNEIAMVFYHFSRVNMVCWKRRCNSWAIVFPSSNGKRIPTFTWGRQEIFQCMKVSLIEFYGLLFCK